MTKRPLYAFTARCVTVLAAAVVVTAPVPAAAQQEPPCAACVALVIEPGQALALPASLGGVDVLVRVSPGAERGALGALKDVAQRGGRGGLLVSGVPTESMAPEVVHLARTILIDVGDAEPSPDVSFALRQRITAARAAADGPLVIGLAGGDSTVSALARGDLSPYVDVIAWRAGPAIELPGKPAWRMAGEIATFEQALASPSRAGAARWIWRAPADAVAVARVAGDLVRAARLLPPGLVASPQVRVTCSGVAAAAYLNPETLETIALARECAAGAAIEVTPAEPGVERIDLAAGATIIRVPAPGASDRFAAGVQVVGARTLAVEEIVARHQAAAARQASAVRALISSGTLTLTFEAPGFPAPVTISADTIIYSAAGRTDLEQRAIRVNGIEFRGRGVPRLPIIEPERVGSPPLAITLTNLYRYRLQGTETVAGTPCYVVAFEPIDPRAPSFRGRAWIAGDSFAMVKVAAVQTGLRGPIVASEQTDEYRKQGDLWLLARSDTRQAYEGAAHRTPIHRLLTIEHHEVNPAEFAARLEGAYRSDAVMLRDTPQGYRYLKRDAPSPAGGTPAAGPIEPVVAPRAHSVRTLAAGVIVDPNISMPLPFAGLSYVDFNLLNTGAQLNAFFGGSYAQLAFSLPSLGGSRWQLAGRAFGIASSYNDRAFVQGHEVYEEAIRQRPAHVSVWILRPLTARASLRIGYDLDYTRFSAADETADSFLVPADQVVHGARVALDVQRSGWNASLWWNPSRRTGWRQWGRQDSGDYRSSQHDFQRYGASAARSAVLRPGLVARLEGAVMAGRDLDRFSRYSFGTFDNRLRGYPAALIRYDRGGVLRGALGWATARFARLDLFADSAVVRDPGFGREFRNYTGVGAAVEAPAPFGILIAVEWGYGFRGVNASGRLGTQVVRVTGYKVF